MDFFESDVPQGNGRCSDNACPCPEVEIKRGAGYLYVDQELVDFRKQHPSLDSARAAMREKQAQIASAQGGASNSFIGWDLSWCARRELSFEIWICRLRQQMRPTGGILDWFLCKPPQRLLICAEKIKSKPAKKIKQQKENTPTSNQSN